VANILDRYFSVQTSDDLAARRGRSLLILILTIGIADLLVAVLDALTGTRQYLLLELGVLALLAVLFWYTRRGHRWPPYVFLAFLIFITTDTYIGKPEGAVALALAAPVVITPLIAVPWLCMPVAGAQASILYILSLTMNYTLRPMGLVILGVLGLVAWLSSLNLENALKESRRNANALGESNRELEASRFMLESAARDLERRSAQLEASAEVARAATTILDMDRLIQQVVALIHEQFGLYYVGLFLVDPAREWAVLRAGTGEAGQRMLARGHRLRIGTGSMIGWSIEHAQSRVALDIAKDADSADGYMGTSGPPGDGAVRLATPELTDTRSEAALPLRSRGQVLGALSVQSDQPGAFDPETIAVLQMMVDQVAVALDNATLFSRTETALEDLRTTQRRYLGRVWREFLDTSPVAQVDYVQASTQAGGDAGPANSPVDTHRLLREAQRAAMVHERTVAIGSSAGVRTSGVGASDTSRKAAPPQNALVVPLKLRGQVIGTMALHETGHQRPWTAEEIALAESVAEQVTLTVENLRLMDETQRRAARERLIGEVTGRVRQTLDMETILKTAANEIGRTLGLAALEVRLGTPWVGTPMQEAGDRKNTDGQD
jgi:GAF domain-containing protein